MKDEKWVFYNDIPFEATAPGVKRKILAYTDEVMIVENTFEEGGVGAMHHHPHTQITYVIDGEFKFTIGDEVKIVKKGDSLLKKNGIEHGCVCLKAGHLLDVFTPMRQDFIK